MGGVCLFRVLLAVITLASVQALEKADVLKSEGSSLFNSFLNLNLGREGGKER